MAGKDKKLRNFIVLAVVLVKIVMLESCFGEEIVLPEDYFPEGFPTTQQGFQKLMTKRHAEMAQARNVCPYTILKKDFFSRFSRDPNTVPETNEVMIDKEWKIILAADANPLSDLMAGHFAEFMERRMEVPLAIEKLPHANISSRTNNTIVFLDSGGGKADVPESFTIKVSAGEVRVIGQNPEGLRDGIVRLVDEIGFRQAPILKPSRQVYTPRLKVRRAALGSSYRDTVFMGYNAVDAGGGSLYALSTSDAIPELIERQRQDAMEGNIKRAEQARRYGLKTYLRLTTVHKFPENDPIFKAHPEIRGTRTWVKDGDFTICTEHPLVKKYLSESIEGIFRADPKLDGITIIIGGEGFYHCFMRPYGKEKGHTNCPRCEALGAATVVTNLCNLLAKAARKVNPNAEVIAWPYSAEYVWSADRPHTEFIKKLKPGVAVLTEMAKDELMEKPGGVKKRLYDYSIDLIGPGERATQQLELGEQTGVPIHVLSMAEETFEANLLPHIPCFDRWVARAEAMASCGAESVYVWQMGPYDAASSAEINKFFWWEPVPGKEELLQKFATRIAGKKAGPHLRKAWKNVSRAVPYSLRIGEYYKGTHYTGPAHPMCANPDAKLPGVFYGNYLFLGEIGFSHAMKLLPTFHTSALQQRGCNAENLPIWVESYRNMEKLLKQAVDQIAAAKPLVPQRCLLTFEAEEYPIRWFYHTARTEANFCQSTFLRDRLLEMANKGPCNKPADIKNARKFYKKWRQVLLDEKANTAEAIPVIKADTRIDFYHRGDHSFPHITAMMQKKLELLDYEINEFLPSLARRCGIATSSSSQIQKVFP